MVKRKRFSEDEWKASADGISLLPDELLVSILCLLSFKEATATSILGRRWRYLHTWTRKLDLDGTESILKLRKHENEERCKYFRWVEGVVRKHRSSTLEEFRVFFNLDRSHTQHIDEWVRYALSRRVERLELNLTYEGGRKSREYHECYIFPYKHVIPSEFKFMKKLCTNYVNVSGEFVEELLRNCPLLEQLSVAQSGDLLSLEIIKPFPSFKCLEISLCHDLKSLVIRDSNIVTLKVHTGRRIQHVVLANVPLLTEIWTGGYTMSMEMESIAYMFSSVLPQLHMLKLYIFRPDLSEAGIRNFCSAVKMSNLKQFVVVDIADRDDGSLLPLINLINASTRLERFVVEAPEEFEDEENAAKKEFPRVQRKMAKARSAGRKIPRQYPYLKEVEFVGYRDVRSHFEMVMHFVENGIALENIIVDPRGVKFHLDSWWDYIPQHKISHKILAMARALKKYIPSRINVKIL